MKPNSKLPLEFYSREDVLQISQDLLGKFLVTKMEDGYTSGMIVETEAYTGISDKAAHVYGDKHTKRTATMYGPPGHAYIYLCYGIHHMMNVVTNRNGVPNAVLIRALEPAEGIKIMMARRSKKILDNTLTRGPGSVGGAMGLNYHQDGTILTGNKIWIEDRGIVIPADQIQCGPRIGVSYAQEDALLPYRFWVDGNPYVSKNPHKKDPKKTRKTAIRKG